VLISIGRLLGANYRPTVNRTVPYWCISTDNGNHNNQQTIHKN